MHLHLEQLISFIGLRSGVLNFKYRGRRLVIWIFRTIIAGEKFGFMDVNVSVYIE
jgi:hypothetical protein